MVPWNCVLELNTERHTVTGSEKALADAVRRGCDLRIYTEFIHNETNILMSPLTAPKAIIATIEQSLVLKS